MTGAHVAEVTTLGDLLVRAARRHPTADALVFPDHRLTYAALLERATLRARQLVALGVPERAHVGILMPNLPEFVEVLFGVALAGAVAVPVNARYRARELRYVVGHADLDVLFTTDHVVEHVDFVQRLHEAFPDLASAESGRSSPLDAAPPLRHLVLVGGGAPAGFVADDELRARAATIDDATIEVRRGRVAVRDPAIVMYTSGTTAQPKGCVLTHEALVRNGRAMADQRFFLTAEDRMWDPLPMFHMAAILPLTATVATGGAFLSMTHIEAGPALEQIERERATIAYPSFPTLTSDLIAHPEFSSRDLSRVRMINNVAPPDMLRKFQRAFPQATQVAAYGLTEAGGVISWNELDDDLDARVTTCGRPLRGIDVRIVDPETGRELPADRRGEIQVRGYCLFEGYYRDPKNTAAAITDDGWLRTGDLGSLDAHGRIRYEGRLKDMLKVGGENVAAVEIESYLATHPAVKLVQVVGIPDERYQEVPAAFVELIPGASATEQDLIEYCDGQIASFKVPRLVRFVEEWPMSATKIQKFRLREMIHEASAGEGSR